MAVWHNAYITDKNKAKRFNTTATGFGIQSELKNLQRHIDNAKKFPQHYTFLDAETAYIMLDGEKYGQTLDDILDDDLLNELNK